MLTVSEAAKRTGQTRQNIYQAIKKGRLSATKNNKNQLQIDLAELIRAYPDLTSPDENKLSKFDTILTTKNNPLQQEINVLQTKMQEMEIRLSHQYEALQDYRRRLDESEEERRHTQRQFSGLLTDQSRKPSKRRFPWLALL